MLFIDWKTHFLSGAVAGYALAGNWKGAIIGGIAGIVPDIDDPRSKIGRPLFFVSIPLNQIFGHRTLTHSFLFVTALWLLLQPFTDWANVIALGILVHIIGDMLTGMVNILYPIPLGIGLPVGRVGYVFIDRITRISLLLVATWIWGKEVYHWVLHLFY